MFDHYGNSLRKGVRSVYADDSDNPLSHRLQANVSRFAAYKAYHVTSAVKAVLNDVEIPLKDREKYARETLKTFDRWHDTECNTTVARSRTAKQFAEYMQPDNLRLFPNLRWLPSRSVILRESHIPYYNRVWPKTDAFWASNAPGSPWGCKCDTEETDEGATDNDKVPSITYPAGLEGNPYFTGEIFTDRASYIVKSGKQSFNEIAKCYFTDSKSSLQISVLAHADELSENIRTGRILAKKEDVIIRPHFTEDRIKNPEFEINGLKADAKRVEVYKGIKYGFKAALEQKCKIVIIDFDKNMRDISIKPGEVAKYLDWRKDDFSSGAIEKCYLIHNGSTVMIDKTITGRDNLKREVEKIKLKE